MYGRDSASCQFWRQRIIKEVGASARAGQLRGDLTTGAHARRPISAYLPSVPLEERHVSASPRPASASAFFETARDDRHQPFAPPLGRRESSIPAPRALGTGKLSAVHKASPGERNTDMLGPGKAKSVEAELAYTPTASMCSPTTASSWEGSRAETPFETPRTVRSAGRVRSSLGTPLTSPRASLFGELEAPRSPRGPQPHPKIRVRRPASRICAARARRTTPVTRASIPPLSLHHQEICFERPHRPTLVLRSAGSRTRPTSSHGQAAALTSSGISITTSR